MRFRYLQSALLACLLLSGSVLGGEREFISDPNELSVAIEVNRQWDPMQETLDNCRYQGGDSIQCICENFAEIKPLLLSINSLISSIPRWKDVVTLKYSDTYGEERFLKVYGARYSLEVVTKKGAEETCSTYNKQPNLRTASPPLG